MPRPRADYLYHILAKQKNKCSGKVQIENCLDDFGHGDYQKPRQVELRYIVSLMNQIEDNPG